MSFCAGILAAYLFTRSNPMKTLTYARRRLSESAEQQAVNGGNHD